LRHSSRGAEGPSNRPRVLLDARPLQGADAFRGIGGYVRGLLEGLLEIGYQEHLWLLVDAGLPPVPVALPQVGVRRRYRGRASLYEDAVVLGTDLARLAPRLYHAPSLRLPGRAPCPVVATVHDLIPWRLRGRTPPLRRYVWRTLIAICTSEIRESQTHGKRCSPRNMPSSSGS